ncbi:MAG: helix-turn-helix domain-containing protein [bacterium]
MKSKKTSDAIEILHRRYIRGDAQRTASIQEERVNAHVARTIRELREEGGLTQKELADLIGTTQSVISRLEDADYEGHSLSMLDRIARALNQRIRVLVTAEDKEVERLRDVFREVVRNLRRERGLTIDQLAEELEMDRDEVIAMERNPGYRPPPATLYRLSQFYDIPLRRLGALAGAVREVPQEVREEASRFAAQSESFAKLSREERELLDRFVSFLKKEA